MISNKPTGRLIKVTRSTGLGSNHLGPCELCSKNTFEVYASRYGRERIRPNGEIYTDKSGGSTYGHKECIEGLVDVKPDCIALKQHDGLTI